MTDFERYKELKAKLDIVYDGIHYNRVLALYIYNTASKKPLVISIISSLKNIIRLFLALDVSHFKLDSSSSILSTYGLYDRSDHKELYKTVTDKFGQCITTHNTLNWRWKIHISPKNIYEVIRDVFKALKDYEMPLRNRLAIASFIVYYRNTNDELSKLEFVGVDKYLSMCSVLDLENLITQHMKLRKIPTYSLMEGIYIIREINTPIDGVAYENMETDHLLSWGQFTMDEFLSYGIDKDRLLLAGYPKSVTQVAIKNDNKFENCMVLLSRHVHQEANFRLLDILSRYTDTYNFCLKLHPSSNFELYDNYASKHNMKIIPMCQTVNDSLSQELYDFCISVDTTAYYESLMRGIPCLRYDDKTFDMMYGYEKDVFTTSEDYENVMSEITDLDRKDYQTIIDDVLKYAIGFNIDNYKEILSR